MTKFHPRLSRGNSLYYSPLSQLVVPLVFPLGDTLLLVHDPDFCWLKIFRRSRQLVHWKFPVETVRNTCRYLAILLPLSCFRFLPPLFKFVLVMYFISIGTKRRIGECSMVPFRAVVISPADTSFYINVCFVGFVAAQ